MSTAADLNDLTHASLSGRIRAQAKKALQHPLFKRDAQRDNAAYEEGKADKAAGKPKLTSQGFSAGHPDADSDDYDDYLAGYSGAQPPVDTDDEEDETDDAVPPTIGAAQTDIDRTPQYGTRDEPTMPEPATDQAAELHMLQQHAIPTGTLEDNHKIAHDVLHRIGYHGGHRHALVPGMPMGSPEMGGSQTDNC